MREYFQFARVASIVAIAFGASSANAGWRHHPYPYYYGAYAPVMVAPSVATFGVVPVVPGDGGSSGGNISSPRRAAEIAAAVVTAMDEADRARGVNQAALAAAANSNATLARIEAKVDALWQQQNGGGNAGFQPGTPPGNAVVANSPMARLLATQQQFLAHQANATNTSNRLQREFQRAMEDREAAARAELQMIETLKASLAPAAAPALAPAAGK